MIEKEMGFIVHVRKRNEFPLRFHNATYPGNIAHIAEITTAKLMDPNGEPALFCVLVVFELV